MDLHSLDYVGLCNLNKFKRGIQIFPSHQLIVARGCICSLWPAFIHPIEAFSFSSFDILSFTQRVQFNRVMECTLSCARNKFLNLALWIGHLMFHVQRFIMVWELLIPPPCFMLEILVKVCENDQAASTTSHAHMSKSSVILTIFATTSTAQNTNEFICHRFCVTLATYVKSIED